MSRNHKKIAIIERGETRHIAWGFTITRHYHGESTVPYKKEHRFSLWRFLSCLEKKINWEQGSLRQGFKYAAAVFLVAIAQKTTPLFGQFFIIGAIALGNTSNKSDSGSGDTTSFDSGSGSDRILIWGFSSFDSTSADRQVSSCSYNSQALTKETNSVADNATSNGRAEIWYRVAPSTGTNNLAVTFAGANNVTNSDYFYAVFTGVDQSTPINTSNNHTTTGGTQDRITLTTTVADCMLVDVNNGDAGGQTLGAGQTSLMDLSGSCGRGSYKLATTTGSYNMDMNTGSNDNYAHGAIALAPVSGAATGQPTSKRMSRIPFATSMRRTFGAIIS